MTREVVSHDLPSVDALALPHRKILTDDLADRVAAVLKDFPDELELSQLDHAKRRLRDSKSMYKGKKSKDIQRPLEWDAFLARLEDSLERSSLLSVIGLVKKAGIATVGEARNLSNYNVSERNSISLANRRLGGKVVAFFLRAFMKRSNAQLESPQSKT